jgi:hypothetical protein
MVVPLTTKPFNSVYVKLGVGGLVLLTLGKTFRPVRRKNSAAEKKIRPPTKFDFFEGILG